MRTLLCLPFFVFAPLAAAQVTATVEGGIAHAEGATGGLGAVSLGWDAGTFGPVTVGLTLRPEFFLTPVEADSSRYRFDAIGNGQTRCRDYSNGQFAATLLCEGGNETDLSGAFSGAARLDTPAGAFGAGAGYRIGRGEGPFAVATWGVHLGAVALGLRADVGAEWASGAGTVAVSF